MIEGAGVEIRLAAGVGGRGVEVRAAGPDQAIYDTVRARLKVEPVVCDQIVVIVRIAKILVEGEDIVDAVAEQERRRVLIAVELVLVRLAEKRVCGNRAMRVARERAADRKALRIARLVVAKSVSKVRLVSSFGFQVKAGAM